MKDSPAAMGECYCSQLFKLEQALAELPPEERYEKRLEQEKPVLDALLSWANEMQAKTAPKSALGKAIHSLREQWPYLTRYLEDGRLELSNNRAERSIKPFVMGRKNWLFANTPGGAQASSVIYSLIETAKANGLDPYRYLLWILQTAPQLSETNKAWAESLLPANAPEECYIPQKKLTAIPVSNSLLEMAAFYTRGGLTLTERERSWRIARTFKSSLLQRWSAHLWQNGMAEARSGIMNEG